MLCTTAIKIRARTSMSADVRFVNGTVPLTVTGDVSGYFTLGGTPIAYPNAYRRKGWSNMYYRPNTQVVTVGLTWLHSNMPEIFDSYMRMQRRKHKIRVYQSTHASIARHLTIMED